MNLGLEAEYHGVNVDTRPPPILLGRDLQCDNVMGGWGLLGGDFIRRAGPL